MSFVIEYYLYYFHIQILTTINNVNIVDSLSFKIFNILTKVNICRSAMFVYINTYLRKFKPLLATAKCLSKKIKNSNLEKRLKEAIPKVG